MNSIHSPIKFFPRSTMWCLALKFYVALPCLGSVRLAKGWDKSVAFTWYISDLFAWGLACVANSCPIRVTASASERIPMAAARNIWWRFAGRFTTCSFLSALVVFRILSKRQYSMCHAVPPRQNPIAAMRRGTPAHKRPA